jgi:hypothetical protein
MGSDFGLVGYGRSIFESFHSTGTGSDICINTWRPAPLLKIASDDEIVQKRQRLATNNSSVIMRKAGKKIRFKTP